MEVAFTLKGGAVFQRAKYRDSDESLRPADIKDPVGTKKWDGASFFLSVENDGSLKYHSRRPSVKGGFPERSAQLPQLTAKKLPQFAGQVFNVELVHTGLNKSENESHRSVSGILNSLPAKAIETQATLGPVRAVIHNVISPDLPTFKDKLLKAKDLEDAYGNSSVLWAAEPHVGLPAVIRLINDTKKRGHEGVVVTSLTVPESSNVRLKVKHTNTFNLRIVDIEQEKDKTGKPKPSMGSLVCSDANGRVVANVGTGFTHEQRKDAWENKHNWIGKDIQVKTMGLAAQRLRMPVFNGDADGDLDIVL